MIDARISVKNIGNVPAALTQADGTVHEIAPGTRKVIDTAAGGSVTDVSVGLQDTLKSASDGQDALKKAESTEGGAGGKNTRSPAKSAEKKPKVAKKEK